MQLFSKEYEYESHNMHNLELDTIKSSLPRCRHNSRGSINKFGNKTIKILQHITNTNHDC